MRFDDTKILSLVVDMSRIDIGPTLAAKENFTHRCVL